MKEDKDVLEAMEHFADSKPARADRLEQAEKLTLELYGEGNGESDHSHAGGVLAVSRKKTRILTLALCGAALLLVVGILLICFLGKPKDEIFYFGDESVYSNEIADIEQFKTENSLTFFYYDEGGVMPQYEASYLEENDRLAFIIQGVMFVSQSGFDTLQLGICFSNDEFQKFDDFNALNESVIVDDITVNYRSVSSDWNYIYSKFVADDVVYYLSIETTGGVEVLQSYVELLFS